MAAHCCCLPVKVNGLSKQQAGTGSSPRGAHALEGPQSHAAMPKKLRFWLWSPNTTSIHHSIDPTPQPTHPGSGVPRRTKAASEGLGSRKRARGTDSLEKPPHVRKEVTIPCPRSIGATTLVSPRAEQSLSGFPWEQHSQLLARSHALRCGFPSSRASSSPGSSHLPEPSGMGELHQEGLTLAALRGRSFWVVSQRVKQAH